MFSLEALNLLAAGQRFWVRIVPALIIDNTLGEDIGLLAKRGQGEIPERQSSSNDILDQPI
jgi:hypothetical protein